MLTYSSNLLSQTYPEQLADSARHALELVANDTVPIDVTGR
jgi:NADPH2:quinone reductase